MKKTILTIVALIAVFVSLGYIMVLLLADFGVLSPETVESALFVGGYGFLPVPIVGFLAGVLLQVLTVRSAKRKQR